MVMFLTRIEQTLFPYTSTAQAKAFYHGDSSTRALAEKQGGTQHRRYLIEKQLSHLGRRVFMRHFNVSITRDYSREACGAQSFF